jgi:hypothetical protein
MAHNPAALRCGEPCAQKGPQISHAHMHSMQILMHENTDKQDSWL